MTAGWVGVGAAWGGGGGGAATVDCQSKSKLLNNDL